MSALNGKSVGARRRTARPEAKRPPNRASSRRRWRCSGQGLRRDHHQGHRAQGARRRGHGLQLLPDQGGHRAALPRTGSRARDGGRPRATRGFARPRSRRSCSRWCRPSSNSWRRTNGSSAPRSSTRSRPGRSSVSFSPSAQALQFRYLAFVQELVDDAIRRGELTRGQLVDAARVLDLLPRHPAVLAARHVSRQAADARVPRSLAEDWRRGAPAEMRHMAATKRSRVGTRPLASAAAGVTATSSAICSNDCSPRPARQAVPCGSPG